MMEDTVEQSPAPLLKDSGKPGLGENLASLNQCEPESNPGDAAGTESRPAPKKIAPRRGRANKERFAMTKRSGKNDNPRLSYAAQKLEKPS